MTPDDLEQLAKAVDDAMAPAALEVWREVWPVALAELTVDDAFRQAEPPTP